MWQGSRLSVGGDPGQRERIQKQWERSEEVLENKGRALKNEAKTNPN
jgi:hypothetical protein